MRVFLLYPPITRQERYSSALGNSGGNQIPLGIFYLASFLRENGLEVRVVDAEAQNLDAEAIIADIRRFRPDVIGIGSTTVAFHRAVEIAERLREERPELPLVLGGPHLATDPVEVLNASPFRFGVVGEGEETFLELLRGLEIGRDVAQVRGIVFKSDRDRVVQTPSRPLIDDLDRLPPPAYDLIPSLDAYAPPPCNYIAVPVANIITSRGCPNQCTFCDQSVFGRKLRQRSPENIAAEIAMLYRQFGVREIAFVDDTFTIGRRRIFELFSILDREGIRFPWTCMSRINTVDEELLRFMKSHGCWHVSFGIESGDPDILKTIRKNIDLEQVRKVIGFCAKIGLKTKGFFMVGHPGETPATLERTIRFALSLPLDDVVATINTPIPGSVQYAEAERYGTLDTTDWRQFNYHRPVFVPTGLSEGRLQEAYRLFYRRFYLRPRIVWRYFKSFFGPGGVRRFFRLARSLPFLFTKTTSAKP